MYQWKSDDHERTRAMPHIKTYTKVSPDGGSLAFVMLTRFYIDLLTFISKQTLKQMCFSILQLHVSLRIKHEWNLVFCFAKLILAKKNSRNRF